MAAVYNFPVQDQAFIFLPNLESTNFYPFLFLFQATILTSCILWAVKIPLTPRSDKITRSIYRPANCIFLHFRRGGKCRHLVTSEAAYVHV